MTVPRENEHLWRQFISLGERIGDGDLDASEAKWMNREYRKLSRILIPELKEQAKEQRKQKAKSIDEQMAQLLPKNPCLCGGALEQARSGSKIAYCMLCNARYKAGKNKNV